MHAPGSTSTVTNVLQFTAYALITTCAHATTICTAPGKYIAKDINFQVSGDDQGECCVRVPTQKSFIEQQLPVFPSLTTLMTKRLLQCAIRTTHFVGHVPQELFCSLPDYPAHLPTRSCTYTIHTHI